MAFLLVFGEKKKKNVIIEKWSYIDFWKKLLV